MRKLTIQAFLSGTMWSISSLLAPSNLRPSYGDTQLPDSATQSSLTTTFLPSRLRTNSLQYDKSHK